MARIRERSKMLLVLALVGCLSVHAATQCEMDGTCREGAKMFPSQPAEEGPGPSFPGMPGGDMALPDMLKAGAQMLQTPEGSKLMGDLLGPDMAGKLGGMAGMAGLAGGGGLEGLAGIASSLAGGMGGDGGGMGGLAGLAASFMGGMGGEGGEEGGGMAGMAGLAQAFMGSGVLGEEGSALNKIAKTFMANGDIEGGMEKFKKIMDDPSSAESQEVIGEILSTFTQPDMLASVKENVFSAYRTIVSDSAAQTMTEAEIIPLEEIPDLLDEALGMLEEDGDERMVPEIITDYGYPCETHNVTTSDGYNLQMHRIPHGKEASSTKRPVVLLMHGLLDSSAAFVIDNASLAYTLADNGYDVWLGNARGNLYGREGGKLSYNSSEFWSFTWEDMALHDLPAMIDYSIQATKADNLAYIGHSQGSTMGLAGFLSMPKQTSDRVRLFIALAPVGNMPSSSNPILKNLAEWKDEKTWALQMGSHEALPCLWETKKIATACDLMPGLCAKAMAWLGGGSADNLQESQIPFYLSHTPAGTSAKNLAHWSQMVGSDQFRGFSAPGKMFNFYDLSKSTIPLVAISGQSDKIVSAGTTEEFLKPYTKMLAHRQIPGYGHLDFMLGKDAHQKFHPLILAALKSELTVEDMQRNLATAVPEAPAKEAEAAPAAKEAEAVPAAAEATVSAADCQAWAASGECESNKEYMLSACASYCQKNAQEEDCSKFVDSSADCEIWAKDGECEKNSAFMMASCKKSCAPCKAAEPAVAACENRAPDAECAVWAKDEQCTKNRDYMALECRKECKHC